MNKSPPPFEKIALRFTRWLGSPSSLVIHTFIFIACFVSVLFGIEFEDVLLIVTTAVSLEAIYLALFIQMTINSQSETIKNVEEDIDEIQEDIDEIQENVDVIQDDVGEITLQADSLPINQPTTLQTIYSDLKKLVEDVEKFKQENKDS
jgi:low affinity Fe/Cu permease